MASFRFLAATAANETHAGVIEAETAQDALSVLHARGLYVIRIGQPTRLGSLWTALNRDIALRPPLRPAELARLSQEWAGFVEAEISVEESLALVGRASKPRVGKVLSSVRDAVKAGMALHEALDRVPGAFPPVYRALIQAGEAAGHLGPTLRRLGDDLTARRALTEEVRNALLYPLFLLITATAGILVLLLVVVPNLETLIGPEGEERLPGMTRLVLAVSHLLRDHGALLMGLVAASSVAASLLLLTSAGRERLDSVVLKVPVIGPLVRTIETGRFVRTFGALLAGGVTVSTAMLISLEAVANRRMRAHLRTAHRSIISGTAIGDAVAAGALGEDAVGLIRVGERTGRLAQTLERAAVLHEARATRQLKALTVMLTPLMTISFGAAAGVIVYAMLSTILGINELAGP
jgi:general secretion pathway protein F